MGIFLEYDLAILGSGISIAGVLVNNLSHDYRTAMLIWCFSNAIFVIYFYGRRKSWWDGGVSNTVMCGMYLVMLVTGVYGVMIP